MQTVLAANVFLASDPAGAVVVDEISAANLRTILNVADGATADQTNVSGTAATVTAAAPPNITSVGTLTGLNVSGTTTTTGITSTPSSGAAISLNSSSATGNPYIEFTQNGTRRTFIQHNDTDNTLKLASEFGAISLLTDSGGSETERLGISSSGNATFTGGLTVDSVLKSPTRRFSVTSGTDAMPDRYVVFIGGTTSMTT